MAKRLSKKETQEKVKEFFSNIKSKDSKDVKKIKVLAMNHNIKLGKEKRKFCNKCLTPYKNSKTRIKNNFKIITCGKCENVRKWKL